MEAKELMIGDWVNFNLYPFEAPYTPCKVNIDSIYRSAKGADVLRFEPIPLTEEILKLNGFTTDNDHTLIGCCIYHKLCGKNEDYKVTVRLLNGWVKIESFDDRRYTLLDMAIQPRYVHNVQHALRLCGLNELADNFKV